MTPALRKGWFKSTRSAAASHCVETAFGRAYGQAFGRDLCQVGDVHVRDSKNRRGGVLSFDSATWIDFISGVKSGEFGQR